MCSLDNCSHNGEVFHNSVSTIAKAWVENGLVEADFAAWLDDETKVSFPWSMIDKITPRPSKEVQASLEADHRYRQGRLYGGVCQRGAAPVSGD